MKKSNLLSALLMVATLGAIFTQPETYAATTRVWSGGGTDNYWATGNNWGGTSPAVGDNLFFDTATRQNNTNNMFSSAGITNGWLVFSNGGFTLNGSILGLSSGIITNAGGLNVLNLPVNLTGNNQTWNIASGSELQFAGLLTNGAGANPLAILVGGGNVRIATNGNVQSQRWFTINNGTVTADAGNVTVYNDGFRLLPNAAGFTTAFNVTNGATVKLTGAGSLRLGQAGSASGGNVSVNVSSGSFEIDPTTSGVSPAFSGCISVGETAGVTTTLTQSGGLVFLNPILYSASISSLNLVYNAGGGTYNLNGGMLMVRSITNALSPVSSAIFNFNGGVLTPSSAPLSGTAFIPNTLTANVQSGGAIISNSTAISPITIAQNLAAGSPSGGLTKLGNGTMNLTGANTYTGNTTVSNGLLSVTTASTGGGAYTLVDGAELDVSVAASGRTLASSSLNLGSTGTGSLTNGFVLGSFASTTTPAVTVSGALNMNGTVTVNVSGTVGVGSTYLLISYGSLTGTGGFVAGLVPTVAGYAAVVTNNTSAQQVQLYYVPAPQPVKWAVGGGNWDISSLNWETLAGAGPTNYVDGAAVTFDDSASGTSPITVTLNDSLSPGGITNAASSKTYVLAGSGNILSGPVVVSGGNTFVVDNGSGNFFSAISINTGSLQLGNLDTGGSLGSVAVTNNGSLILDRTDSPTVANFISGSGGLTQNGNGTVTLSGANNYAGTTAINSGEILMGNATALSTNTISIASGATLDINGNGATLSGLQPILVSGSGLGGIGALYSSGAGNNNAFRNVSFTGDTSVGGPAGAIIGLRTTANTDPGLVANGYSLTKVGSCQLNLNGGTTVAGITNTWFLDLGNIDIQQGVLSFERHAGLGNPTNTITVETGATLQCFALTPTNIAPTNSIVMTNATLQGTGAVATDSNTIAGQITLSGPTNNINTTAGTVFTLNGPISGAGGVTFGGTLVALDGANTYTGNTTISSGTLALTGGATLPDSPNIIVAGGATLDVSGLSSGYSLGAGQTLSNTGATTANLNAGAGGFDASSGEISLNFASGTPSFSVSGGALTLSASTVVAVNNTGATLAPGTYLIIAATGSGSVAGTVPPAASVANGPTAGTPTLSIMEGQLYLTVGGTSTVSYGDTGPFPYDGLAQDPSANFSGSSGAQTSVYVGVSVSYGPSASAPTDAGTYYVSNTLAGDANYFGTTNEQVFTISPLAIAVTADPQTKVYGTVDPVLTYTFTPALAGSDSFSGALSRVAGESVASYAIGQGTLSLSPDYTLNFTGANLSITPAALGITANSTNKAYGTTVTFAGTEFTASGLVGVDSVSSVTLTSAGATNTATAGSYPIIPSAALGSGLGNYTITYTNGTLTVTGSPNSSITSIVANPDGSVTMTFSGSTGVTYRIQSALDLGNPAWTDVSTNTVDVSGFSSFTDTNTTNMAQFYRVVCP